METTRRFPAWLWWSIAIGCVIAIAAAVAYFVSSYQPRLPPGLAEKRREAVSLLEESGRIEDVDIRALQELEAAKAYADAVVLLERALAANASREQLSVRLVTVSEELSRLALVIEPDSIGAKAIEAFGLLTKLAEAEYAFYDGRRELYEVTRDYYLELAAERTVPFPRQLAEQVEAVNADFERTQELRKQFSSAISAFDVAVQR